MSVLDELGLGEPDPPDRVRVSDHAIRRYLERVDVSDPYPASTIREAWKQTVNAGTDEDGSVPRSRSETGLKLIAEYGSETATVVTVYHRDDGGEQHEVVVI